VTQQGFSSGGKVDWDRVYREAFGNGGGLMQTRRWVGEGRVGGDSVFGGHICVGVNGPGEYNQFVHGRGHFRG